MDDYRIQVGFLRHPKTKALRRALGLEGVFSLLTLFEFCTVHKSRTDGRLTNLGTIGLTDAAEWGGDPGKFLAVLADLKWIDIDDEGQPVSVHDWAEHNGYVAGHKDRSATAKRGGKKSGRVRRKKSEKPPNSNSSAKVVRTDPENTSNSVSVSVSVPISDPISVSVSDPVSNSSPDPEPPPDQFEPKPEKQKPEAAAAPATSGDMATVNEIESRLTGQGLPPMRGPDAAKLSPLLPVTHDEVMLAWRATRKAARPSWKYLAACIESARKQPKQMIPGMPSTHFVDGDAIKMAKQAKAKAKSAEKARRMAT